MGFARLGLEASRVPHADRNGLLWLGRGVLAVEAGTLRFTAAQSPWFDAGEYDIPYQVVSAVLLGPGTSLTHDVLRLCGRHSVGLMAVGEDGVRLYSAPPFGPDHSRLARKQAELWAAPNSRLETARRMYALRLGEDVPRAEIAALRGIEGGRMRESYKLIARNHGISWQGRRYDRNNPDAADPPNQALNHAASAVSAAAEIAVACAAAIPQLGFIHEESSRAFCLDVADLYRTEATIPWAFEAARQWMKKPDEALERKVRRMVGERMRRRKLIPDMIDRIKELLHADGVGGGS
ncbi:MAG: CRISP-associated protein Cas1 [Desulfovibrionales bacterium]|jgi:CRISPR-associated protein Cas1|nr:CRISP-associated protein Cas1 [Desulfovibrionales bacterium]